jgi:flagellar protein FlbD
MIPLTRLNKTPVVVNADQILLVEATPDTTLVLASGDRIFVRETVDEVVELALRYQQRVHSARPPYADARPPATVADESA